MTGVRATTGPGTILRLALRELRAGPKGFGIFIACIALGVMVIAAVGALSDALKAGFARQGEAILGGDITFSRMHKRIEPGERAWLDKEGRVSETATMRAMARRLDGEDQALVEMKAADAVYPLAGEVKLAGDRPLQDLIGAPLTIAADPILLDRLRLKPGDRVRIGEAELTVGATIAAEPDAIADRLTYGPRVFLSQASLDATRLVQPGTLIRWRYALKIKDGIGEDPAALAAFRARAKSELNDSGFSITDRRDPSPQVSRTLERLRQFLTLLGMASLMVGGVGVANAVATFIDRRRKTIATMKSLGASGRTILAIFLVQVLAMAAVGVAVGLGLGSLVPPLLTAAIGESLPIRPEISLSASGLLTAAAYGFLVSLLFALWPLGQAELVRPTVLFRDEAPEAGTYPRPLILAATAASGLALLAFAVLTSDSMKIALLFCLGLGVGIGVFLALGTAVTVLARRLKRPRTPELALAQGNIGARDGLARSVVLSLGSGLTLLVAVALADTSLVHELTGRMPEESPNYFVLDIPKDDYPAIKALVLREAPGAKLEEAPMLRGRLVRIKETPVEEMKVAPEAQWVLNGDRGLTYAEEVPDGSKVVKGTWWEKGYSGEPLVSFETELAERLGLGLGDKVTVNVLGRNLTARIANLREVKWESLTLNFVMVFSPNALASAPHTLLATITLPKATTLAEEAAFARTLGRAYPAVSAIRVKDAIDAFNAIFARVMTAVRVASAVTLVAGALVLAGALATAQRRRVLEAVILKAIGATRRRILVAHFAEYTALAAVSALFAVLLGALAAAIAVTQVMEIDFTFALGPVAQALLLALGLVGLFGGLGTVAVLRARPVPVLRSE